MNLFLKNSLYRALTISRLLNALGSYIYNLVFVIYAASLKESSVAVFIANIITIIPTVFTFFVGIKADKTTNKGRVMIIVSFMQGILFIAVAYLIRDSTFFIFSIICIINVMTDISSDYVGGLRMSILQKNLEEQDFFEAYSFTQFILYFCSIVGQTLGVYLLTISNNNFTFVATINALSFLLSGLVLLFVKKNLTYEIVPKDMEKISLITRLKNLYKTMELIFKEVEGASFKRLLVAILIINALGGSLTAIYNFYFMNHKIFNLSYGESLVILEAVMIVGMLAGSLTPNDYFSKKSLKQLLTMNSLLFILVALINVLNLGTVVAIFFLACASYILAKGMPKLDAIIMANIPTSIIAQSNSFLSMVFTLSLPLGTFLFSSLALYSIGLCWMVFGVISLGALIMLLKK